MNDNVRIVCLLAFLLFYTSVFAQKKITTRNVSESVRYATVDRPGDLYIVTVNGQIQRFDKDGNVASVYKNNPAPTLFDPRDGSRLFAYFRSDQHFEFLDPSFSVTRSGKLDPAVAVDPWLMCMSGDYNFWVFDAADKSLKKINASNGTVTVDAKISEQAGRQYHFLRLPARIPGLCLSSSHKEGCNGLQQSRKASKDHRSGPPSLTSIF